MILVEGCLTVRLRNHDLSL